MQEKRSSILEAMSGYGCLAKNVAMNHRGDLTRMQLEVLLTLHYGGQASMTELSRFIAVSNEQGTRATTPLVERGLVKKRRNGCEHRVVEVFLTEKGEAFVKSLEESFIDDIAVGFEELTDAEKAELIDASNRASKLLWKALKRSWTE